MAAASRAMAGTVALITGGSRGLGKAFAARVLASGGKVALADVNEAQGKESSAEFNAKFGESSSCFVKCDVTNYTQLVNAYDYAEQKLGEVNLVCNNAGIAPVLFEDMDLTVAINLTAVMKGTQLAGERMKDGGVVINIASMAGILPVPLTPVYAATKAGVVNFTRSVAPLFKKRGIRVNALCPAFTRTNMVTDNMDNPMFKKVVESTGGIMETDIVVDAFTQLVTDTSHIGSILQITPHLGITPYIAEPKL